MALEADYGTITSGEEHFYAWKTLHPADDSALEGLNAQQQLIAGVLNKANLLQILRTSSVFMDTDGGPRLRWCAAISNSALLPARLLNACVPARKATERSGVVCTTKAPANH